MIYSKIYTPRNPRKEKGKKALLKHGEMARVLIFLLVVHQLIFLPNPVAILAAESTNKSEIEALLHFKQGISATPLKS